jgi:membrane protein YqaA with SNARE-associated domain
MEHGQDMTYWSENHRLLFAAAEYLAGQFWPEEVFISQRNNRKEGPAGAPRPGDMTGKQHMAHARVRVLRWLQRFGAKACLLSWLPIVGDPLCAVAGWLKLPFWPCVGFMAIGKFARYLVMTAGMVWLFPGWFAG